VVSWTQDADKVIATLRDVSDGSERTVHADYLVAADGYTSPIRTRLGIPLEGGGKVGHLYVITFEADLSAYFDEGAFNVVALPGTGTSIIYDGTAATLWVDYFPDDGQTEADFSEQRCLERVRAASAFPTWNAASSTHVRSHSTTSSPSGTRTAGSSWPATRRTPARRSADRRQPRHPGRLRRRLAAGPGPHRPGRSGAAGHL